MRYKFFPGSEWSPPDLLGGIVDLDRPQNTVASVFLTKDNRLKVRPIQKLAEDEVQALQAFAAKIPINDFKRVPITDIMQYATRRRAIC